MMKKPIFIVGASRSGTTLLSQILTNHSNVYIHAETHYFDDLRPQITEPEEKITSEDDLNKVIDYFLSIVDRPYGHGGDNTTSDTFKNAFIERANSYGGSSDAFFEALLKECSPSDSEMILGEKTPRHVFQISQIIERYPDCRIVGIVRDPRAVTASYKSWSYKGGLDEITDPQYNAAINADLLRAKNSFHPAISALLWRSSALALEKSANKYGNSMVHTVRYEDLVNDPQQTTRQLCDWLAVDFEEEMLNVHMSNSSFTPFEQKSGIKEGANDSWRKTLTNNEIYTIEKITRSLMHSNNYDIADVSPAYLSLGKSLLSFPLVVVRALKVNRHRYGSVFDYLWRRISPFFSR